MLSILIQKELKAIILSPKFTATFVICSLLMLLSVYIGIQEYQHSFRQYDAGKQLIDEGAREATSWNSLRYRAYRPPDPMQIFVSGLSYDIGRWSAINSQNMVKLRNSAYSDDPIFAVFRFVDFAFIVLVVLSLFAIMFTYDAVNGEREDGTLKLVFANSVPRAQYILAKCIGGWLGLVVPICLPILLSVLLVLLFKVPFSSDHWLRLAMLFFAAIAFFSFFIILGVLISALTRSSSVSFLLALVAWIVFVLIVPRAGVIAAGQILPVPSAAEIEGQAQSFSKERWAKFYTMQEERWQERNLLSHQSEDDVQQIDEEKLWAYMEEDDAARRAVQEEIDAFDRKVNENLRHRRAAQERLAFSLSRFSPASAFQLAAMDIAGSDIALKSRNESAMDAYRTQYTQFVQAKQAESGPGGGAFMIQIDTEKGVSIGTPRDQAAIDASQLPVFSPPSLTFSDAADAVLLDVGLLLVFSILAFGGAFAAFLRYDVR